MGIFELPDGYREIKQVDMQKDKKLAVLVNLGAFAIAIPLMFLGIFFVPFSFEIGYGLLFDLLGIVILMILYLVGHELVHGFFFKKYSGRKAKYGFTGLYAYAGSDAFFGKRQYVIIGLAPVVFFGVLFLLCNVFLPAALFWPVYFLQVINLSGAAGDFYICCLMGRMPADILVKDAGISMSIYARE